MTIRTLLTKMGSGVTGGLRGIVIGLMAGNAFGGQDLSGCGMTNAAFSDIMTSLQREIGGVGECCTFPLEAGRRMAVGAVLAESDIRMSGICRLGKIEEMTAAAFGGEIYVLLAFMAGLAIEL